MPRGTVTAPRRAAPNQSEHELDAIAEEERDPVAGPDAEPGEALRDGGATFETSAQVRRVSPQISASPSGRRAAASARSAWTLPGRSAKQGTTRSPKWSRSRALRRAGRAPGGHRPAGIGRPLRAALDHVLVVEQRPVRG